MAFTFASCDKDEVELPENPDPAIVNLDVLQVDYEIHKGSLSDEHFQQIADQLTKRYKNEDGITDVEVYMEKYVVGPLQTKLNEIAKAAGCYDFSVTITVYDSCNKGQALYRKTVVPVRAE